MVWGYGRIQHFFRPFQHICNYLQNSNRTRIFLLQMGNDRIYTMRVNIIYANHVRQLATIHCTLNIHTL